MALKSFSRQNLRNRSAVAAVVGSASLPVISAIVVCDSDYNNLDDTALNPAGGYAKIVGNNFETGTIAYFNGTVLTTTFVSSRELRIQTPVITTGSYNLMLFNLSNGQGAIFLNLSVSNFPTITTSANIVLDEEYETKAISASIAATGDTPITFSIVPGEGSLPEGVTLSANGTLSGIAPVVGSTTTYSFVVQAKDAQKQDSTRQFSLTVKTDVVDWVSPNAGATVSAYEYTPFANIGLSATSRAGYDVSFSSNNLPSGLTVTGNTIVGTSNTAGSTNVSIVATSSNTNKTATRNINVVVNPDVVSWSSPANNAVISAYEYTAFSPISLSANSAAGFGVSFTANQLPAGLSVNGSFIVGTSNVAGNTSTTLTATANTTNRNATRNVQFVVNPDIVTFSSPTPGSVFTAYEYTPFANVSLSANSAAGFGVTYAVDTLPTGLSFSGTTISGTSNVVGNTATSISATANTTGRTSTSNVQFNVVPDVVSWSSPANGALFGIPANQPIDDITLVANSAAGFGITYTANGLPTGVAVANGVITGTPTVAGEVANTTLVATASVTGRTSTRYISWSVNISGDAIWRSVSALISGNVSGTNNDVITELSQINATFTRSGTPFQGSISPYSDGWSVYFNGTAATYISAPASANWDFGSDSFTIECWVCQQAITGTDQVVAFHGWSGSGAYNYGWMFKTLATTGVLAFYANGSVYSFSDLVIKPGKWHHVAFVGSGGVLTSYLDGIKSSTTPTYTSIVARSTATLVIGGWNDNNENVADRMFFTGNISNFRVVKGSALYSVGFDPSTTQLTDITNTKLLACSSNRVMDRSSINATMTKSGGTYVTSINPFSPTSEYTANTYGGSIQLVANTDYVTLPSNVNYNITSGSANTFVCEGWYYWNTVEALTSIIDNGGRNTVSFQNWAIELEGSKYIRLVWGNSGAPGGSIGILVTSIIPTIGQWYHIALVKSNNDWGLFVNGTRVTNFSGLNTAAKTSTSPLSIGYGIATGAGGGKFRGYISDVRVYNATSANAPYSATSTTINVPTSKLGIIAGPYTKLLTDFKGAVTDKSRGTNFRTVGAATLSANATKFNAASVYLDGNGSYIQAPADSTATAFGNGDFTVECWINFSANNGTYNPIVRYDGTGTFDFGYDFSTGVLKYNGAGAIIERSYTFTVGTWYHVAVTRASGSVRLHVNGQKLGLAVSNDTNNYATGAFKVGGSTFSASHVFKGYIDDLRITKGVARYGDTYTVPSSTPPSK